MPINSMNVGRDVAIDFMKPDGQVLRLSIVTDFNAKQNTKTQESHGLDGVVRFQYIPGGWTGSIKIDRANRELDNIIYENEQLYYGGKNVPANVIVETITEVDGTTSQWRYEGVMFAMPEHGNWRGDAKIEQSLDWSASFRKKVQ